MHNSRKITFATIAWLTVILGVCVSHASADETAKTTVDTPKLELRYFHANARVCLNASFGERLPDEAELEVLVRQANGPTVKVQAVTQLTPGGLAFGSVDVQGLAPGNYSVLMKATNNGQVIGRTTVATFTRRLPEPWMINTYGNEDIVLKGFEPLNAVGTTVTLWGRTYDFGNSIMPAQIINQGQAMLARPINWHARIQGEDYPLEVASMELVTASETRALYQGQGTLGDLSVTSDLLVEYDGFMKFKITFAPQAGPVEIEKLWMDVPLVPLQSTNMFHPTRRSGTWDKDWKDALRVIFTNTITLGTPDISLQWLTESDEHYFPVGNKEALATLDEKETRIFRNTVIGAAKQIKKPFTLTFALHAGPVRKRPTNWRGWTMKGRRHLNPARHTSVSFEYFRGWWSRAPGSLIPRKNSAGGPAVDLQDRIDGASMYFDGFRHFNEKDPEKRLPQWQNYEHEWQRMPPEIMVGTAPGWNQQGQDLNSSWSQWHIYNCYKLFSETGFRGLYYDSMSAPMTSINEGAGSGYIDEAGVRHPTSPIFSLRETQKRVYAIVHRFRPDDGIVIIHTASFIQLPVVSFCDIIYDGEMLSWVDLLPPNGNFFDTYRDDLFQMVFSCKNYGPIGGFHDMSGSPNYLDAPGVSQSAQMPNQRKLWAKWLMHDIHTYGGSTLGGEELLYLWLDQTFDIAGPDVRFHPYWDHDPAVKVIKGTWTPEGQEQDLASKYLATAYTKPGGQALVIVVRDAPNNYDGPVTVHVNLDRTKLGLPEGTLVSLELESLGRKTKGVIEGDVLKVPVAVDDFSAVIIKPAALERSTARHTEASITP